MIARGSHSAAEIVTLALSAPCCLQGCEAPKDKMHTNLSISEGPCRVLASASGSVGVVTNVSPTSWASIPIHEDCFRHFKRALLFMRWVMGTEVMVSTMPRTGTTQWALVVQPETTGWRTKNNTASTYSTRYQHHMSRQKYRIAHTASCSLAVRCGWSRIPASAKPLQSRLGFGACDRSQCGHCCVSTFSSKGSASVVDGCWTHPLSTTWPISVSRRGWRSDCRGLRPSRSVLSSSAGMDVLNSSIPTQIPALWMTL